MSRPKREKHKRQVVIIIVEGQSDENALTVAINEFFENKYGEDVIVLFAKMKQNNGEYGGDITSAYGVEPHNIQMVLNKTILMPCIDANCLMPKYVTEVVQIIDTDGAFVPDSSIFIQTRSKESNEERKTQYRDDGIYTYDENGITTRNERKRANIEKLLELCSTGISIQNYHETRFGNKATTKQQIVPFSLYYFSCNLDHVINNNANINSFLKVQNADQFGRSYGSSLSAFISFLNSDHFKVELSFLSSWDFIKDNLHSVRRYTNINLLVE